MKKEPVFAAIIPKGRYSLGTAPTPESHIRMRAALAAGFSSRSVGTMEPVIQKYSELLITKLREQSKQGLVNLSDMITFLVADLRGELVFGESFNAIQESELNLWIRNTFKYGRMLFRVVPFMRFWLFRTMIAYFAKTKNMSAVRASHRKITETKLAKRLDQGANGSKENQRIDLYVIYYFLAETTVLSLHYTLCVASII
jgi:cytochrome P450